MRSDWDFDLFPVEFGSFQAVIKDDEPPKISVSGNPSVWTNKDVVITVSYTDNIGIATQQYSFDGTNWVDYTVPFTVSQNGTLYFRATDKAGNEASKSEEVTKIDKVNPTISAVPSTTETTPLGVWITVTYADNLSGIASQEYSWDGTTWTAYTAPVKALENGTVYFRTADNAGNTASSELVISNIVPGASTYIALNGKEMEFSTVGNLISHTQTARTVSGNLESDQFTVIDSGWFNKTQEGLLWKEVSTGNIYMQNDVSSISEVQDKKYFLGTEVAGYTVKSAGDFFGTGFDGALLLTPDFGTEGVSENYGLAVWAREDDGTTKNGWLGALVNTWKEGDPLKGDYQSKTGDERNAIINANNYRYEYIGVADFNADGKDDVLLRNCMPTTVQGETITGSGDVFIFLTDTKENVIAGNRPAEGICYAGCATGGWNILGFGDFDGDGTDDVLLSDGTGLAGWKIQDGERKGDFWFGNLPGDYQVIGVADFNADGTDDIVLRSASLNEMSVWTVKNGDVSGSITLA